MGVDSGMLTVTIIVAVIAVVAAIYASQQAKAAQDSAAAAIKQADAAGEQVRAAEEQVALGRRQLDIAEKVRREQTEPYVVIDIQPSTFAGGFLNLVIENIGTTVARNVRFSVEPPMRSTLELQGDPPLADARIFTHGVPMLPPRRRIEILFDFSPDRYEKGFETLYQVTINAEGPYGPIEPLRYEIDLRILYGWQYTTEKTIHSGVKTLEKMQQDLHKIPGYLRRIGERIDTRRESKNSEE
jgi:hypothetical protein